MFEDVRQTGGVARHLKADVEALPHVEFFSDLRKGLVGYIDGPGSAEPGSETKAVWIDIGHHDVSGSSEPADRGGHAADGAGSGDENVFSDEVPGESGMNSIAERIEGCRQISGDGGIELVDIAVGEGEEFGEGTRPVDSHSKGVGAQVAAACEAVSAAAADEVPFAGHIVPYGEVGHSRADLLNVTTVFVPHGHGRGDGLLRPLVPVPDMEVRSTDRGLGNSDQNVHGADLGDGDVEKFKARFGPALDEGTHASGPPG